MPLQRCVTIRVTITHHWSWLQFDNILFNLFGLGWIWSLTLTDINKSVLHSFKTQIRHIKLAPDIGQSHCYNDCLWTWDNVSQCWGAPLPTSRLSRDHKFSIACTRRGKSWSWNKVIDTLTVINAQIQKQVVNIPLLEISLLRL